ncbi:MAG: EamA-like transporter family protein [Lachnospiraceae bacterium]|nr:EamA-like transporter family protein [Robinsoniella sp.]MDY3765230.1 EamA-like transporter family protein [Lachnospiraceae bacterium]
MKKFINYLLLHLNIMLFSFTGVFSKLASNTYKEHGIFHPSFLLFLFLMLLNCGIYALAWQRVIKHFSLSVAYANRSVYLIWSQLWAVLLFHETLSLNNIIGMIILFFGVLTVQKYAQQ